jgi:hypothetical protein
MPSGKLEWSECPVLDGFLATTSTTAIKGKSFPYQVHTDWKKRKVVDLWLDVPLHPPWHSWKVSPQDLQVTMDCDLQPWKEMVNQRKI